MVTLHHHLHSLLFHAPGRIIRNTRMAMQFHCRNAFLILSYQIKSLEPQCKWQLGGLKDSASR